MRLILLLLLISIWIHNQILSFASETVTTTTITPTEAIDLQDGHPNHRLWQKMMESGRSSSSDWYVDNLFYQVFAARSFFCLIKLIYKEKVMNSMNMKNNGIDDDVVNSIKSSDKKHVVI
jgi:hypothetical protein